MSEGKVSVTPNVAAFFHEGTYTITYVVNEQEADHCAIIDSVLDYDPKSGRTSTPAADSLKAVRCRVDRVELYAQGRSIPWGGGGQCPLKTTKRMFPAEGLGACL